MRIIILNILVIFFLISCSTKSKPDRNASQKNHDNSQQIINTHKKDSKTIETPIQIDKSELPADGKYRYEVAFAEWDGKSMGEKVTIVIKGDSIQVIYEGDGQLSLAKKGDILDSGIIRKHKSGNWIISQKDDDIYLDEYGGCTGGPSVIDFKKKKYWMC